MHVASAFKALEETIAQARHWFPVIVIPTSQFKKEEGGNIVVVKGINPGIDAESSSINIVELLTELPPSHRQDVKVNFNYPSGAIFEIEGYKGTNVETREKLKTYINQLAIDNGTVLSIVTSKKGRSKRYDVLLS